jgi:hypothetical protein
MHNGIAPPHGLALSILRSMSTHSILGFLASASAAQDPDGPPPTTATLYFAAGAVNYVCKRFSAPLTKREEAFPYLRPTQWPSMLAPD